MNNTVKKYAFLLFREQPSQSSHANRDPKACAIIYTAPEVWFANDKCFKDKREEVARRKWLYVL